MTTVLVVDDSRLAREMVSGAIAALHPDWTIVTAVDGDDALNRLAEAAPAAALVDFNMPGMDGLTLAGHLRERMPQLPVGILTANVQDALRRKAEELGCRFIPKPVTVDKIRTFFTGAGL
ncbi:response regulator [Azospirillum halopraeferens]|uniref:response regulator n=1 Tax=Azospirillum halopraeferens TaxID=34010 RepID=UPI00040B033D|nr:response regulator [Azospirillum halopraeferens]